MAKSTFTCFKIYTTTNSYPDSEKYIEETEADILLPEIVEIKKM
ncbi:hypothetical protein SAMN04488096_105118 [Mesonia phycicola]|uniref:Uncharacterized protein n=1 Tax=Mesonia phycicola TaxID=579105 RepID=A0A1M6EJM4_9FLAO|nr:hypothetical protein [Mesonia phycicola]SHI85661.1 hypothetical protein SAMN04488096_105118 [Mesonia phycicola]